MLSRARIFAAVTLLVSCFVGLPAWAQVQNLEAGKSASQLFAGTCNACHKSPRGLLKSVSPGSLPGFLREHYTTSGDMASQLATFLISNGASDARQAKQGPDKPGADKQNGSNDQADRQGRKNRSQEAARPDDGSPPGDGGRQSRKRLTRPGEPSEEANAPAQAAIERGPDGHRLSGKQRSGRPGRPGDEPSMANEPPKTEAPKTEAPKTEPSKTESSKAEPGLDDKAKEMGTAERAKPDAESKPGNEAKSDAVRIDAPRDGAPVEKPVARRDPVPAVTPAQPAVSSPAATSVGSSEATPRVPAPASPEPPAITASAPPTPPSSGPPAPPISR